jgi:hypothetical protein
MTPCRAAFWAKAYTHFGKARRANAGILAMQQLTHEERSAACQKGWRTRFRRRRLDGKL